MHSRYSIDSISTFKDSCLKFFGLKAKLLQMKESPADTNELFSILNRLKEHSAIILQENPDMSSAIHSRMQLVVHSDYRIGGTYRIGKSVGNAECIEDELNLVLQSIKRHYKSYSIWKYRRWLISRLPLATQVRTYAEEILLSERLLEVDYRNFHTWNHRRWASNALRSLTGDSQLRKNKDFAKHIISNSFGNYSAWHERVINQREELSEESLREDLYLVQSAMYCDPNDDCAFLYAEEMLSMNVDLRNTAAKGPILPDLSQNLIDTCFELMHLEGCMLRWPLWLLYRVSYLGERLKDEKVLSFINCHSSKILSLNEQLQDRRTAYFDQSNLSARYRYHQDLFLRCLAKADPQRSGCYTDYLQVLSL